MSSRYNLRGGQPYAESEGGPSGLAKWYMSEVVPAVAAKARIVSVGRSINVPAVSSEQLLKFVQA